MRSTAKFRPGPLVFAPALLALALAGCGSSQGQAAFPNGSGAVSPSPGKVTPIDGQLVFAQQGSLFRVDREGKNLEALTSGFNDSEPHAHPLGTSLVFSRRSARDGAQHIYTIDPSGASPIDRTPDLQAAAHSPNYSADGTRIVFSASTAAGRETLFVMDADGSHRRALTRGEQIDTRPAFSNDGRFVVFERAVGGATRISKVSVAEGVVTDLTDGRHHDLTPTYLSEGDSVVFERDGDLVAMDDDHAPGDSESLRPVSFADLEASHPVPSGDGDALYFLGAPSVNAQSAQGTTDLWSSRPNGENLHRVTSGLNASSLAVSEKMVSGDILNQVNVEVVNDSGLPDSEVFVLLGTPQTAGQQVTGLSLLTDAGGPNANASGTALSTLTPVAGKQARSPFTGATHPVYPFSIQNLVSGQLNVSYRTPVSIVNGAAPTASTAYRYDKMEITYESSIRGGGGNLTSIDFYGIPLQVEVTHPGDTVPDPLQTKTFYASTGTILKTLAGMGPSMTSGQGWIRTVSGAAFDPQSTDYTDFTRILSPNTIAAADTPQARPAPYPSLQGYLDTLVGKSFAVNGAQHGGYSYQARVQRDGQGGFDIVCTGTTTVAPAGPPSSPYAIPQIPANATVTVHLPQGRASSASDPAKSMDFFVYACVANQFSYSVEGFPFQGASQAEINSKVGYANSTAYGSLVGDLQAALNFGYPDSKFVAPGGDIDSLFGSPVVLPYPYPYGGARKINDGFYNPYAAVIYYLSDAYGHPFSDRLDAASPLYSLTAGDTIRITILSDNRLDAPLVTATSATNSTVALSWPTVAGATGYRVSVEPEAFDEVVTASTPGPTQTLTLTGLAAGTPYLVSVKATGPGGIASTAVPVQGFTTGLRAPLTKGPIALQVNLGLPNGLPNKADLDVFINGQQSSPTANAQLDASFGLNVFGLEIKSRSETATVYRGNYFAELVSSSPGNDSFSFGPLFTLQYNLTPLTAAPVAATYPLQGNALVIGTPFTPKPFYQFFPTVFP